MDQIVATETAILHFEKTWRHDDVGRFDNVVAPLPQDIQHDTLIELIRIDIEFVSDIGLDADLAHYFQLYPSLSEDADAMEAIAYEDFRCRTAAALPISRSRYQQVLPAPVMMRLEKESWWSEVRDLDAGYADAASSLSQPLVQAGVVKPVEENEAAALGKLGYDIVGSIGRGTQSSVYLCKQRTLSGRLVVLKVTQFGKSESEALSELRHSNIMPIHDTYRLGERTVLKMPFLGQLTLADFFLSCSDPNARTGRSLVQAITSHGAEQDQSVRSDSVLTLNQLDDLNSEELALLLFTKLSDALAHSHRRGILHCDIKPENILIGADGEPLLFDFNLARDHQRNILEAVGGTPPYMSPEARAELDSYREQATNASPGQPAQAIDARADIYSLGVVAKEFLAAARPTNASDTAWPESVRVDPSTRSVVDKCLEQDPEKRYSDAKSLRDDLQRQASGRLLLHAPESITQCSIKLLQARPVLVVTTALILASLGIIVPLARREASERRRNAIAAFTADNNSLERQSVQTLTSVLLNPNGRTPVPKSAAWHLIEHRGLADVQTMIAQFDTATSLGLPSEPQRLVVLRHLLQVALQDLHAQYIAAGVNRLDAQRLSTVERWLDSASAIGDHCSPDNAMAISRLTAQLRGRIDKIRGREVGIEETAMGWFPLQSGSPFEQYLRGVDLLLLGRWRRAISEFESVADRPEVASVLRWSGLGRARTARYEMDQGIACFTEALKRHPNCSELLTLRGKCYTSQRRSGLAANDYHEAIRVDQNAAVAWTQIVHTELRIGLPKKALEIANAGCDAHPRHIPLRLARRRVHLRMENASAAKEDWAWTLRQETQVVPELLARAKAKGRFPSLNPLEDIERARELEGETDRVLLALMSIHVNRRNYEEAIVALQRLREKQPDELQHVADQAVLLARIKKNVECRKLLATLNSEDARGYALYQAACAFSLLGEPRDLEQALELLTASILSGFLPKDMRQDPDLIALRDRTEFEALVKTCDLRRSSGTTESEIPISNSAARAQNP